MSRYGRNRPFKRTSEKDFVKKDANSLCLIFPKASYL